MPKGDKFQPGDLVFAKVKGYPAWPAKITSVLHSKYKVFFYGTYEVATLKNDDIWFYNEERANKFEGKYRKKKGYIEGMYQIRNTPEIADVHVKNEDTTAGGEGDGSLVIDADDNSPDTSATAAHHEGPVLSKPTKRKAEDLDDSYLPYKKLAMSPSVQLVKTKLIDTDTSSFDTSTYDTSTCGKEEEAVEESQEKEEDNQKKESGARSVEGRKLWVRVKDTDDIIEINLDKDRPDSFPSEEARKEWERASAKKALKFKKRIENGEFVPPEIQKKLDERAKLSDEEREQINADRKARKRKEKLRWLKIEQRLVELDIAVRTSLSMKRPSPDRCIQALECLEELGIAPLMLKKQPEVISTLRKTRKYVGPADYREWTDEEARNKMERCIPIIQSKAEVVFQKFIKCFSFKMEGDDEVKFLTKFSAEVEKLKRHVETWEDSKVLSMTRDPTQPLSASNPLSDFDDEE